MGSEERVEENTQDGGRREDGLLRKTWTSLILKTLLPPRQLATFLPSGLSAMNGLALSPPGCSSSLMDEGLRRSGLYGAGLFVSLSTVLRKDSKSDPNKMSSWLSSGNRFMCGFQIPFHTCRFQGV